MQRFGDFLSCHRYFLVLRNGLFHILLDMKNGPLGEGRADQTADGDRDVSALTTSSTQT